jgi:hypothetical protein
VNALVRGHKVPERNVHRRVNALVRGHQVPELEAHRRVNALVRGHQVPELDRHRWLLVLLAGCAPPPSATETIEVPPLERYQACPLATKLGEFRVDLTAHYTAVSGSIAQAVVPGDVREVAETSGGCRLLRRRLLACPQPCGPGMTCGEAGRCLPYPDNLDAGTVTLAGLARPVKMQPDPTGRRYWDTTLPHPGYRAGANIRLQASGGELPAFTLGG